jgi:hypothetical protein
VVTVVNVNLNAVAQVGVHNLHELVNVMEYALSSAQQVILKWNQACMGCRRIGENLQHSDTMIFCRIYDIVPNSCTKQSTTCPLSRIYYDLPRRVRAGVENLQLRMAVLRICYYLGKLLLTTRIHLDAIDLQNEIEENLQACLCSRASGTDLKHANTTNFCGAGAAHVSRLPACLESACGLSRVKLQL